MSARELPGFLDLKNALNVAAWRLRMALNAGRDLHDFREPVPPLWQPRDWKEYDTPTYLRVGRKVKTELPALVKRQAA